MSEKFLTPIDHGSLGAEPLLERAELNQIVETTDLEFLPEIEEEKFLCLLNKVVERTIREQLRERLVKETRERLKKHFETYRD